MEFQSLVLFSGGFFLAKIKIEWHRAAQAEYVFDALAEQAM
jgi:hypothetical protein